VQLELPVEALQHRRLTARRSRLRNRILAAALCRALLQRHTHAYSPERARFNAKIERQQRRLNDGTQFEIYKRYLDRQDIGCWSESYDAALSIEHVGTAFVAVSGRFGA
jgi:hypothetical protein